MWGHLVGLTYWLLYDLILSLCICSNHTVGWLLLAGLVCYIFTVSVIINFLAASCSLKELSFTSASLNRAASCLIQLSLLHYFIYIIFYLSFCSLFLTLFCFLPQISLSQMCLFCSGSLVSMNFYMKFYVAQNIPTAALALCSNKLAQVFLTVRHVLHVWYVHMYRLHIDYAYFECKLTFWISSSSKKRPQLAVGPHNLYVYLVSLGHLL